MHCFAGMAGAPVLTAPASMNLLMPPGSGSSAFQNVQQQTKPMLTGMEDKSFQAQKVSALDIYQLGKLPQIMQCTLQLS